MRRLLSVLLLLACWQTTQAADAISPEAASGFGEVKTATAEHSMAVTANPLATQTARDILRRGGSAADAAIAAQLVLGLVEPQSSGLGGGAFMLYWDNGQHRLRYYDGRETAPAAVDDRHFLTESGKTQAFLDAVVGGYSVGTPGAVKLMALSHREHGKLPWATLFEPAIQLAEQGFAISPRLHTLLKETPELAVNPAIREYFFSAEGTPKPVGFILKNPAYAKTLRQIAKQGESAFYKGPIARDIVRVVHDNPNRAGKLALSDLRDYQALERQPICGHYRAYKVCGAAPPSSGGTTVLAILGMLERFDPAQRPPESVAFYHLFSEASRLAFSDRNTYVADPDFVEVPTEGLVAPKYLAERSRLIDPQHAMATVPLGWPAWTRKSARVDYVTSRSPELISTSHLNIVDADGNALSMTTSVESAFGSRLLVDGFLLNNQLTDFSFAPRGPEGQRIANRIEPGKRPRSSMAPIIVFKDDKPVLLLGSPGGARIIDYVAKSLIYILDDQLTMAQALASPNIVDLGQGIELERGLAGGEVQEQLRALGHRVVEAPQTSGLNAIRWSAGKLEGSSDPRREGVAAGD